MIRRPPRSPLFPYPTLFRSLPFLARQAREMAAELGIALPPPTRQRVDDGGVRAAGSEAEGTAFDPSAMDGVGEGAQAEASSGARAAIVLAVIVQDTADGDAPAARSEVSTRIAALLKWA